MRHFTSVGGHRFFLQINLSMSCEDLKQKARAAGDFESFMAEMTGKPFRNPCKRKPLVRLVRFEAEKPQMIYEDTPSETAVTYRTVSIYVRDLDVKGAVES